VGMLSHTAGDREVKSNMAEYRRAHSGMTKAMRDKRLKILRSTGWVRGEYRIRKDPNGYFEIWLKGGKG